MQLPSYTSIPCMYGSGGVADNVSSSLEKWFWWSLLAGAKDPNRPTLRSGLSATRKFVSTILLSVQPAVRDRL